MDDQIAKLTAERDYYKREYERLREIADCNDPGAVGIHFPYQTESHHGGVSGGSESGWWTFEPTVFFPEPPK